MFLFLFNYRKERPLVDGNENAIVIPIVPAVHIAVNMVVKVAGITIINA